MMAASGEVKRSSFGSITSRRQGFEHIPRGRQAQDVPTVPQRVEQQFPAGEAVPPAMDIAKQRLHTVRMRDLGNARLCCDQWTEAMALTLDPGADRNGEAVLRLQLHGHDRGHAEACRLSQGSRPLWADKSSYVIPAHGLSCLEMSSKKGHSSFFARCSSTETAGVRAKR